MTLTDETDLLRMAVTLIQAIAVARSEQVGDLLTRRGANPRHVACQIGWPTPNRRASS